MQSAATVLGVLRERGRRGLPLERLYRQLFNPQLYLLAYGRIYANHGAMTPGADGETADGMSLAEIGRIIDALRHERYRFTPVQRAYIPKKNGKKRPLGLPSWSDKLVGEVIRLLLEAYYEPRFSGRSHGFRPGRGCHTALSEVAKTGPGQPGLSKVTSPTASGLLITRSCSRRWRRKFTITGSCGSSNRCCKPDTWRTGNGTPRFPACRKAASTSPILSNIYLDRLDRFVETVLIPEYTRGQSQGHEPCLPPGARRRCRACPQARRPCRRARSCASSCAACRAWIRVIPATGGCATAVRRRHPPRVHRTQGRSRADQAAPGRRSCMTISSWN